MIRTVNRTGPPRKHSGGTLLTAAHRVLFLLFLAMLGLVVAETCGALRVPWKTAWPETALVLAATVSTLTSLSRQLPGQNVLLAAVIIALLGGLAHTVGALASVPFGPYAYTPASGPRLFDVLPWWIPLLWIVALLNSRGVARLILRPWRKTRTYGFRVLGLTVALALLFDLGFEPFATRVKDYWLWHPTKLPLSWYGTPLTNSLGWAVTASLILAFATPSLINKSQVKLSPDYCPLAVWTLLNLLFAAGSATHHLWLAAGVTAAAVLIAVFLAVRGGRW